MISPSNLILPPLSETPLATPEVDLDQDWEMRDIIGKKHVDGRRPLLGGLAPDTGA